MSPRSGRYSLIFASAPVPISASGAASGSKLTKTKLAEDLGAHRASNRKSSRSKSGKRSDRGALLQTSPRGCSTRSDSRNADAAQLATPVFQQTVAAMLADIVEAADHAIIAAQHDNGLIKNVEGQKLPGITSSLTCPIQCQAG